MLPVVIPLGAVIFGLLVRRLVVKRRFTVPRAAVAAALGVYAAGIAANTVFPIYVHVIPGTQPWTAGVVFVPFVNYELEDAVTNVLVFVPLGILFALMFAKPSWWRVLIAVTATSLGIEMTQFAVQELFGGGHIADTSDLLSNVVGGLLGYLLFATLTRMPWFARFAERFRWAPAETADARARSDVASARYRAPREE